ncbi:dUTP diphosphatase, partial [bacterium]|nr:dUTP diphosphatase [bacterium]
MLQVKFKKLNNDAILPSYGHPGDAGMDLYSLEDKLLKPG